MATDYYLIPKKKNFKDLDVFDAVLRMLCIVKAAELEKIGEGVYNVNSKTEAEVGFSIDYIDNDSYYWEEGFDSETETPSGPHFYVRTHGNSLEFTMDFLEFFINELNKKELYFELFDPQESKFINK